MVRIFLTSTLQHWKSRLWNFKIGFTPTNGVVVAVVVLHLTTLEVRLELCLSDIRQRKEYQTSSEISDENPLEKKSDHSAAALRQIGDCG